MTERTTCAFPLVSIVMPVFNGSDYLEEAIRSALGQSYSNLEVLVVNDGSTDEGKTRAVAASFGDAIRYLDKPNGGVASALNLAIGSARGSLISWLSHDDVYLPDKIRGQVAAFQAQQDTRCVVFCDEETIDARGNLIDGVSRQTGFDSTRLAYSLLRERSIGGCALLIPKAAFAECGGFDESLKTVQDYHMWYRLIAAGYAFVRLERVLVRRRVHGEQGSRRQLEEFRREKDWLFCWAADALPVDLICDGFEDPARALLELAFAYKCEGLPQAFKRFRQLAVRRLRQARLSTLGLLVTITLWSRSWASAARRARRSAARLKSRASRG